ncbi:MAG: hypothetical protein AAGA54_07640 [Myxococcota bacterium]
MPSLCGSAVLLLATLVATTPTDAPTPPPPEAALPRRAEVMAYSDTVTAQFRSFAYVERRTRRVKGALGIGAGALLIGIGITNAVVKQGTTAQGSGLGVFGTGAVAIAGGTYGLIVPGPAESFTRTALFDHGSVDGWTPEMLDDVVTQTYQQAMRARRRRRAVGTLLVIGGTGAAATISTLLGLELAKNEPDGALTSSYAQGIATSTGVVVAGVTQLVVRSVIEVLADDLHRRRLRR